MHPIIKYISNKYKNSTDLIINNTNNYTYIYLDSICSIDKVNKILSYVDNIFNLDYILITKKKEILSYISNGYLCVLIDNNIYAFDTKDKLDRGITEATIEPVLRGPKDSFTENHSNNIGLIRKRIKTYNLNIKDYIIGRRTNTKISIIYEKELVNNIILNKVLKKINNIDIDSILDSSYIRNYLETKSIFPTIISTERPDLVCQNILNGKICILVENSPVALILPATLDDYFKSADDYYQKSASATFNRIIRYIAFILTIITPSLYVALMTFNQELIPDQLLISLASQRSQVPFPTFVEIIIFIIIFELLREADIRSPSISGASMSIVGALVLGDAAVAAKIVSPIAIIIVALTSITELIFNDQDMTNSIRKWRIIFVLSTIIFGIIGITITSIIFITILCEIHSFGIPYTIPISPLNKNILDDSIIIKNPKDRINRPNYLTKNIRRTVNK